MRAKILLQGEINHEETINIIAPKNPRNPNLIVNPAIIKNIAKNGSKKSIITFPVAALPAHTVKDIASTMLTVYGISESYRYYECKIYNENKGQ